MEWYPSWQHRHSQGAKGQSKVFRRSTCNPSSWLPHRQAHTLPTPGLMMRSLALLHGERSTLEPSWPSQEPSALHNKVKVKVISPDVDKENPHRSRPPCRTR